MKILIEKPPNYEELKKIFNIEKSRSVYAYNDIIYNPEGIPLQDHVILHEDVHFKQQKEVGGAEAWWSRYIDNTQFRLDQEIEAYRVQYKFIKNHPNIKSKNKENFLDKIASDLSSSIYGNIIKHNEAKCKIKNYDIK